MRAWVPRPLLAISLFCLFGSLWAQTIQDELWNIPDGRLPDLSQTFTAGTTLALSWNALVTTSYVDTTKNLVDLWVTAYDANLNPFYQRVTPNINLTSSGNFAWTIAIPDANLAVSAKYVLRFKAASPMFDPNSGELSSPGFLVLRPVPSTTSTSSSSISTSSASTSSNPSSTTATTSTAQPSQTPPAYRKPDSSGLSSGAKAGIGIAVVVVVVALLGSLFLIFRRKQRRDAVHTETIGTQMNDKHRSSSDPAELPGAEGRIEHPTELAVG